MASGRPFDMKDYYRPIDEETFVAMTEAFDKALIDSYKPAFFLEKRAQYGSMKALKDAVFADDALAKELADALDGFYFENIVPKVRELDKSITLTYKEYMKGQMAFELGIEPCGEEGCDGDHAAVPGRQFLLPRPHLTE